ncbi:MAG: SMC-Scp complex subunit ScpB [Puniceicoccaceae bacterium]|nr:MAG: SMC-Scp complex subunit ScpB [Puniceicoccaceae bacterium]|tara:strand:- start:520 stop:1317 length:798 start_codon:yes stop_codon:yes gene_type:complete
MERDLKKIVEALLLSTSEPLSIKALLALFSTYRESVVAMEPESEQVSDIETVEAGEGIVPPVKKKDLEIVLQAIMEEAEADDRAYRLVEGSKGFYLATAPQFSDYIRLLRAEPKPMKLTAATLETLSIIAYRQPVTRAEIESIRGVSVDSPINRLLEIELIEVMGRAELPGRPIQYGTSEKFLEFSGIVDLDDLPASDILTQVQIDAFMRKDAGDDSVLSDESVGLAKETEPSELPLEETFVEVDWQKENIESDAFLETREGETL